MPDPAPSLQVSDATFDETVLQAGQPVLVDFHADWCGPCRAMAPFLDDLAEEAKDRLAVAKLNVDDNPATALRYGVRGLPTLMLFRNGHAVATQVGALPRTRLKSWVADHV